MLTRYVKAPVCVYGDFEGLLHLIPALPGRAKWQGVRLPMRKVQPTTPDAAPHSPLSPLTSTSPLHPDGLIAPVWVRKHAELVPAVFVLFLRMWEAPRSEEGSDEDKAAREAADREKEKEMDDMLVKEIGDRRRRLGERGIKLTVVLMASAAALGVWLSLIRNISSNRLMD